MKKDYCTQNDQDCRSCSLTNYGHDCKNKPIPANRPKGNKRSRAMANYNGFKGTATVEHVERNIKAAFPTAYDELTGVQYGKLMSVANTSYHDGRNSTGASCEEGLIFVTGEKDLALPLGIARKITVEEMPVYTYREANTICPDGKRRLAGRGGMKEALYRKDEDIYTRIDLAGDFEAEKLSRDGIPVYWQYRNTTSIVKYNGVEIARYDYLI